jgi:hypothetical protein
MVTDPVQLADVVASLAYVRSDAPAVVHGCIIEKAISPGDN